MNIAKSTLIKVKVDIDFFGDGERILALQAGILFVQVCKDSNRC